MNATSSIIFLVMCPQQFLRYLICLGSTGQHFTSFYVCGYSPRGGGGGGILGLMFAGYVPLASQNPYSIIVYFFGQLWTPSQSLFGKCNFRDPNLVTFYLCILTLLMWFQAAECNAVNATAYC